MAENPQIQKVYETIPAYEHIKIFVVQTLFKLSEEHTQLQQYMFMGRNDNQLAARFKADILNFYTFLRSKIYDFINTKGNSSERQHYQEFCKTMNFYIMRPKMFKLANAMYSYFQLIQFCEDYKLSSTTFWTGQTQVQGDSQSGDTYHA